MASFAKQATDNTVIGIDVEGLIQRLMLFEHCIIPSIWMKDIQMLMRIVDPEALCELLDSNAISFYIDSATIAEIGQARSQLNFTGNVAHLQDNEFSFSILKGRDDFLKTQKALSELATFQGIPKIRASAITERVESLILESKGLEIHQQAAKSFYAELRSVDSIIIGELIGRNLQSLGAKPSGLKVGIEEFVEEDFRINSNLTTKFGLTTRKAREISLRALLDLYSVNIRLAHMQHFSSLIGMNEAEQVPWEMKVDALTRSFNLESQRERQFTRVAKIAGIGESQFLQGGRLDLRRLIEVRNSEDLTIFRSWLKETDNKSDAEIKERVSSIRGKLGNAAQSPKGKILRLMLSYLPNLIADKFASQAVGLFATVADSFLTDIVIPKDAVIGILDRDYPAIFQR